MSLSSIIIAKTIYKAKVKTDNERAYIKVMEPDYLILMDIQYDGIKFKYDDYACERFRRNLVDSLTDLQKKYAIRESMIKSLCDLHEW